MKKLTHIDARGEAMMVDVSTKPIMLREAVARGEIRLQRATLKLIEEHPGSPFTSLHVPNNRGFGFGVIQSIRVDSKLLAIHRSSLSRRRRRAECHEISCTAPLSIC